MSIKVYDRQHHRMIQEEQYQEGYLTFLYETVIGRILLKWIFASKTYARLNAVYLNSKRSTKKIPGFVAQYHIPMNDYEKVVYQSFNEFFIRKMKKEARPICQAEDALIAVADAKLTVYPINEELRLNIKNSVYSVGDLIADEELAKKFGGGFCFVYRLTVDDYHRYHFVDDGRIRFHKKINGQLHTVSPISGKRYQVYIENQREVSLLATKHLGDVVQMEVGALQVGKITNYRVKQFHKGDEKGYFSFGGSTVILLIEKNRVSIEEDILHYSTLGIETKIKMGEKIGGISYF